MCAEPCPGGGGNAWEEICVSRKIWYCQFEWSRLGAGSGEGNNFCIEM